MAYNYNNPYQQYPYTNNYGYQQQPMQQNMQQAQYNPYAQNPNVAYQQQAPQVQPQQQTNYLPLTFVSGVEGAKAFIVPPNQVIFLKDSDSDLIFQKKADVQGKYETKAFKMIEVDINNLSKPVANTVPNNDYVKRDETKDFITRNDLNALEKIFEGKLDKLSSRLEKLAKTNYSGSKTKDSD